LSQKDFFAIGPLLLRLTSSTHVSSFAVPQCWHPVMPKQPTFAPFTTGSKDAKSSMDLAVSRSAAQFPRCLLVVVAAKR